MKCHHRNYLNAICGSKFKELNQNCKQVNQYGSFYISLDTKKESTKKSKINLS